MPFVSQLDTPLLRLSPRDTFTLRDACNGVQIFGAIGSGKTSGSGKALGEAYLRAGMGAVICCAKCEEIQLWLDRAKKNGRANSVIVFDERHGINFIDYLLSKHGINGLGSVVDAITYVLEAADRATSSTGAAKDSEAFWGQSVRQVLSNIVPLLFSGTGTLSIGQIVDFVVTAATEAKQYVDSQWVAGSFAGQTLTRVVENPAVRLAPDLEKALLEYWFKQWPAIPDKTRGNILISLTAKLDRFKQPGRLRSMFCGKTTIVPEMTYHGALIICAAPVLTWGADGIIAQQLFKYLFQTAAESRNALEKVHQERPVFLWADEAQYFTNERDEAFLSTCRGSRVCVVFLTQTLPTYYACMGKDKTDAADGLVGKFSTQVFHANACPRTNEFASKMIGRGIHRRATEGRSTGTNFSLGMNKGANTGSGSNSGGGSSYGGQSAQFSSNSGSSSNSGNSWGDNLGRGTNEGRSWSTAEVLDNLVEPRFFAQELKTGGPKNKNLVTAVWFKTSGTFIEADGGNVLFPTFRQ